MSKQYALSDQEIIQLYQSGISQNDIHRKYNISLKHTRAVLKRAGFHTIAYQRIPAEQKKVIETLILAGIPYRAIGEATDISFYVIRDIAEGIPNRPDRRYRKQKHYKNSQGAEFLMRYLAGESFCNICIGMSLTSKEIVRCYSYLDNVILSRHSDALSQRLRAEDPDLHTQSSLAKKYGISTCVVKAHLNI